jgi:hypothetical protein
VAVFLHSLLYKAAKLTKFLVGAEIKGGGGETRIAVLVKKNMKKVFENFLSIRLTTLPKQQPHNSYLSIVTHCD